MSGTTSDKPVARQPGVAAPKNAHKPVVSAPTSASGIAEKSAPTTTLAQKNAQARVPAPPNVPPSTSAGAPPPASTSPGAPAAPAPQRTVKCPKCGTDVRDVARFCQRCHHTMRYECPSCHNQQRTGGKCEKCGIDFLKYIGAVVTQKQAEADVFHERIEQRSTLMKNILWMPFTLGFPIIRDFFLKRERKK
jgi:zinc-ribbon domain